MKCKIVLTIVSSILFSYDLKAAVSDINYVPLDGEFAGRTNINFFKDITNLRLSGQDFILETNQHVFNQTFSYGFL